MAVIRELRRDDDFDVLFALSKRFFEEYERFEPEFFALAELTRESVVEYFSRSFGSASDACFVAVESEVIVGYIVVSVKSRPSFYSVASYGYISGLMVDPDVRGRGIATELLDRAHEWFSNRSVRHILLETALKNERALLFYGKHGFSALRTQLHRAL
jgi:ribosomal protein S18 acetylase RimI-like enzyme